MTKKKTRLLGLLLAVILLLCCIPIKLTYKDGGTVKYQALLWSYTRYHKLMTDGSVYEGSSFRLFPFHF